jgi:hypothetical protein
MSYPEAIRCLYGDLSIQTIDIRDDSLADYKSDYLPTEIIEKPQIICTNPPFNQALAIINKDIDDVADNGFVIMLLRLNFFGSKAKNANRFSKTICLNIVLYITEG